jgi:hypothetical protein
VPLVWEEGFFLLPIFYYVKVTNPNSHWPYSDMIFKWIDIFVCVRSKRVGTIPFSKIQNRDSSIFQKVNRHFWSSICGSHQSHCRFLCTKRFVLHKKKINLPVPSSDVSC